MTTGPNIRPAAGAAVPVGPIREPRLHRLVRRARDRRDRRHQGFDEQGLTLVELLVAFAALIVLLTLVGTTLSTYVNAGTTVTSTYAATDQILPSSIIIQRLLRSQVEPAPTLTTTVAGACGAANVPCPAFLAGHRRVLLHHLLRQRREHPGGQRTGQDRDGPVHPHPVRRVQVPAVTVPSSP